MGNQRENVHNLVLAGMLDEEKDMEARALEGVSSGEADIFINMLDDDLSGVRVILKGKNSVPDKKKANDAIRQAEERLLSDDCDLAAAVLYPQGTDRGFSLVEDSEIYYATTDSEWTETTPDSLPQILRQSAKEIDETGVVAKRLKQMLVAAENKIIDSDIRKMSEAVATTIETEPQRKNFDSDKSFKESREEWRKQKTHASMRILTEEPCVNKSLETLKQPCGTRKKLDKAVADALAISEENITRARSELFKEPQITNLRYGQI